MLGPTGETGTNACVTFFYRLSTHRHISVGRLAKTFIDQLCSDTGFNLEDLPRAMTVRDGWQDRERERERERESQKGPCNQRDLMIMMIIAVCFVSHSTLRMWGCPRDVMVEAMDCGIVVSKFEPQSRLHVHFGTNTLGKGMKPPYPPRYGLNSTTTVLSRRMDFGIK